MFRKRSVGVLLVLLIVIGIELSRHEPPVPALPDPTSSTASEELLDRRIPDLVLSNTTLGKVVEILQEKNGVPIEADWIGLKKWKDMPVDIELYDAKLGDVIAFLFSYRRSSMPDRPQADFGIIGGKLIISPAKDLHSAALTERVYDVRDLLSDEYWGCLSGTVTTDIYNYRVSSLCDLLQYRMEVQNWKDIRTSVFASGDNEMDGLGTSSHWGGRLFVTQTAYNHRLVESVLSRLRSGNPDRISMAPLDRRIDHLEFANTPFRAAIHAIAAKAHTSIFVDIPDPAGDSNIEPPKPITVTLNDMTLESALEAVLALSDNMTFNEYGNGIITIEPSSDRGLLWAADASLLVKLAGEPLIAIDPLKSVNDTPGYTENGASLQKAIGKFLPYFDTDEYSLSIFGTRVIVHGREGAARRVREAVESLSNPVILSSPKFPEIARKPPFRLTHFECEALTGAEAMQKLRDAAGPNLIWRLKKPLAESPSGATFAIDNATPEEVARKIADDSGLWDQIRISTEDGVACIDPADDKEPKVLRAYDISALLDHCDNWFTAEQFSDGSELVLERIEEIKETQLANMIATEDPPIFWHRRMLVLTTPGNQRRLFYLLRSLQAGNPPPEKPH